ncbi:MAG: hypothetical protein IJ318_01315 [Clostridia bacterium]|nr:hypothetical protein [Clostridia bacterium]
MFNFFDSLKQKYQGCLNRLAPEQCVMLGDYLFYVEGFAGIITLSSTAVVFRVKNGVISVFGSDLSILEMTPSTITINGKIKQVERV